VGTGSIGIIKNKDLGGLAMAIKIDTI
jgi:hypothetical protein